MIDMKKTELTNEMQAAFDYITSVEGPKSSGAQERQELGKVISLINCIKAFVLQMSYVLHQLVLQPGL